MKKKILFSTLSVALLSVVASCSSDDVQSSSSNVSPANSNVLRLEQTSSGTRTLMNHEYNKPGEFEWMPQDRVWVNYNGNYIASVSNNLSTNAKRADFTFAEGTSFTADNYELLYTGESSVSSKATEVVIKAEQTQAAPNNTKHFGLSGDCGTATVNKRTSNDNLTYYTGNVRHRAGYLCFLPNMTNLNTSTVKLEKIVITSNKSLAGTYGFSSTGLSSTPTANASNKITLTCKDGFAVPAHSNDFSSYVSKVGSYAVVAPGQHTFKLELFFDKDGVKTSVVSDGISINVRENTVTDVVMSYALYGNEIRDLGHSNAEVNPDGPIVINEVYTSVSRDSYVTWSSSFNAPTAAQMTKYIQDGDPHWDNTTKWKDMNGVVRTGGMWFLKKQYINGFDTATQIGDSKTPAQGKPADTSRYFFLPAAGYSNDGGSSFDDVGTDGRYWSPTENNNFGCGLHISSSSVGVNSYIKHRLFRVFEAQ